EPNDWPEAATPIPPRGRVRGYLGTPEDRDWFSITSPTAGKLQGTVEVPAGIDGGVILDGNATRTAERKSARDARARPLHVEPGRPALVGIARKTDAHKDPKEQALPGLEDPYELVVRLP